jgi:lysophospholipid acyltransferase (LPLAT)-like uncharacterized protein
LFRKYILPQLIYWFYRLWTATWRLKVVTPPDVDKAVQSGEPMIFAHWHRDELSIVHMVTDYKIATMTSTSKDGQLIDYVITRLGGATSKGSSTRGAIGALKGLTRLLDEGYRASMAVDGPRGPIYKVKPGVFELSTLAKAWIVPVGVASSSRWVFEKSWNKARLPKPFSKVVVLFGPMTKMNGGDPRESALSENLATQINEACRRAESNL